MNYWISSKTEAMKPQFYALLAAMAWGFGGYFEKKGLHLGNIPAHVGITIRTAVALVVLGAISFPQFKTLGESGAKALVYMVIGGGIVAGSAGMLCFYAALKGAPIGQVMPIAFTAPLFGVLMGLFFGGEPLTWKVGLGALLTVSGIVLITAK
jgi:bacterial/archaeal transporter family protein